MWGKPPKLEVTPPAEVENVTREDVVVVAVEEGESVGGPIVRRERVDSKPEILILS